MCIFNKHAKKKENIKEQTMATDMLKAHIQKAPVVKNEESSKRK